MYNESGRLTELLDNTCGLQMLIDMRLSNGFITIEEVKNCDIVLDIWQINCFHRILCNCIVGS